MVTLVNRAKMSTSTTGTGTITLGSAEDGYQSFADAGVADGDVVRYVIEDGDDWEIGSGTYTATGTTLTRTVDESSNSDAALNLTGSAVVFITAAAEDVFQGELFAESPNSSAVTPTANAGGSYNSVAIGNGADIGSGRGDSIAIGTDALANQSQALAIGRSATVGSGGTFSTAVGRNSLTNGQSAVALGNSYASGTDSLAAVIDTNSSTYGATGAGAVAIGNLAKATSADSIAIGDTTLSTGTNSLALGADAYALAVNATAIGHSRASGTDSFAAGIATNNALYGSAHAYSVALGYQAVTSADYQIALGSSTAQVKVSGAYTLPTSDGTNGQVLTTNGAGAVTFADAGGGADLYAANESSPDAQPSATGANAIAIGDSAAASGTKAYAIGAFSTASNSFSLALGGSTSAGFRSSAIGSSYASGQDSFAAAIASNSSSYGATGANSIAIGYQSKATTTGAFADGYKATASGLYSRSLGGSSGSTASGTNSFAWGTFASASTTYAIALGPFANASLNSAVAIGNAATPNAIGKMAFGNGTGDHQIGFNLLRQRTTDATQTQMTTNNSSASTTNGIVLQSNAAYAFSGTVVAKQQSSANCSAWEIKGLIVNNGGTMTLVNSAITVIDNQNNWGLALAADSTNKALAINVTGAASTNIYWNASIKTSEVED